MTPEFVAAVKPVIRWAKDNGWQRGAWPGTARNGTHTLQWDGPVLMVQAPRPGNPDGHGKVIVATAQQAIDVLAALHVLPVEFSSAFRTAKAKVTVMLAEALLSPDALPAPVPEGVEGHTIGQRVGAPG